MWPWFSLCTMRHLTGEPLVAFANLGFAAIVGIQQTFDAWNWGVGTTFFSHMKFDFSAQNTIPGLPFYYMDVPSTENARMTSLPRATITLVPEGDWYRAGNDDSFFRSLTPLHIVFLVISVPMFLFLCYKRNPLFIFTGAIDCILTPAMNIIATQQGYQWTNGEYGGSNVMGGNILWCDFYNYPLCGTGNFGVALLWIRLLIPQLSRIQGWKYFLGAAFVNVIYWVGSFYVVVAYAFQPQIRVYAKPSPSGKDEMQLLRIDYNKAMFIINIVIISLTLVISAIKLLMVLRSVGGASGAAVLKSSISLIVVSVLLLHLMG